MPDGRYLVRELADEDGETEEPPSEILIVRTLGAARAATRRRRGKVRAVEGSEATPLPLGRFLLARPVPFGDTDAAEEWLERNSSDEERFQSLLATAVAVIETALHAQRAASRDPQVPRISIERAHARRLGYGTGEELAGGRWRQARELIASQRSTTRGRLAELEPQERVARVLGGKEEIAPAESLLLRARTDLAAGRDRDAALQLIVGLDALLAELGAAAGADGGTDGREKLREARDRIARAATAAMAGPLSEKEGATVAKGVQLCERALLRHLRSRQG